LQLEDYLLVYNIGVDIYKSTGKKVDVITTHAPTFSFAPETWSFIIDKDSDFSFINSQAIVIKQLHMRIMANFVSKMRKTDYSFKIFSTYDEALIWTNRQKELS